jgi:hypothetical protein
LKVLWPPRVLVSLRTAALLRQPICRMSLAVSVGALRRCAANTATIEANY